MARTGTGRMQYMGFEKEPPQPHGPKMRGKVLMHSHSARPHTKLRVKGSGRKRMS